MLGGWGHIGVKTLYAAVDEMHTACT